MARPRKTKIEQEPKSTKAPRRRASAQPAASSAHRAHQAHQALPAEEVASEAYLLFLARGGQHGDALTDWLTAERIVRERRFNGTA